MANYILGDVMTAEAFVTRNGKLQHYFSANTMTDSTINISVTAEEIRGGWGNRLLGKIFHDTNFGVNLTEAMWSLDYLAAQIGEEVKSGAEVVANTLKSQKATLTNGESGAFTLSESDISDTIGTMFANAGSFCAGALAQKIIWVKDCNGDVYTADVEGTKGAYTYKFQDANNKPADGEVCVSFPVENTNVKQLIVSAAFAPQEFSLFLTAKLFDGDSCKKSTGKYAGKVVIEIPRFQLDGTVDLTLNPSSAASVALNGTALAYGCTCGEDAAGEYAKISVVMNPEATSTDMYAKYDGIIVQDADSLHVGDPIIVYLVGSKVKPMLYTGAVKVVKKGTEENGLDDKYLIAGTDELTVSVTLGSRTLTKDVTVQA